LGWLHGIHGMCNGFHGAGRTDLHRDWVMKNFGSQGANFCRHGGREQQCLPLGGYRRQDSPDIGQKAHVKHHIGFIQNQDFHRGEVHIPLPHQVQQATRAGNGNLRTLAQALNLWICTHTAIQGQAAQTGSPAKRLDGNVGLFRQLAGGSNNQGAQLATRTLA